MERTVTTTDKKVLDAAANCSESKRTLEVLFPDVFKKPMRLELGGVYKLDNGNTYMMTCPHDYVLVNLRTGSHYSSYKNADMKDAFGSMFSTAEYLGQAQNAITIEKVV